jgi:hypothetical protein
MSVDSSTG